MFPPPLSTKAWSSFLPATLVILITMTKCSTQETLSCGQTSFQVTFEPQRSAGSGISGGSGGNRAAAAATAIDGGPGGGSIASNSAKFSFMPIDQLLVPNANVCTLAPEASRPTPRPINDLDASSRLVITRCNECSKCPDQLINIHRTLTRVAQDWGLQSLLVIVGKKLEKDEQGMSRAIDRQSMLAKFVYMDVTQDALTLCELSDSVDNDALKNFSKTSVLFVSISFIILMVISLAWLIFYYVQRFRYAHAKDRLQRRLFNAAKKALTRIPTRPVKTGDKELDSDCPVCIDPYRAGDICRQLPCRHIFHKSCVDPWLLEHRTCPMCKSDILKAFGYHVSVSSRRRAQFSAQIDDENGTGDGSGTHRDHDRLSVDVQSTTSESIPYPIISEIHDPFGFSPSTSPQLIQVMHGGNARGFSIIPLTVHSSLGYTQQSRGLDSPSPRDGAQSPPFTRVTAPIERHQTVEAATSDSATVQRVHSANGVMSGVAGTGARLLRAVTSSGARRPMLGHVVNLVHVRSRSMSHQFSPRPSAETAVTSEQQQNSGSSSDSRTATASTNQSSTNGGQMPSSAICVVPIEHHCSELPEPPKQEDVVDDQRPTAIFRTAERPSHRPNQLQSLNATEESPSAVVVVERGESAKFGSIAPLTTWTLADGGESIVMPATPPNYIADYPMDQTSTDSRAFTAPDRTRSLIHRRHDVDGSGHQILAQRLQTGGSSRRNRPITGHFADQRRHTFARAKLARNNSSTNGTDVNGTTRDLTIAALPPGYCENDENHHHHSSLEGIRNGSSESL